MSRRTVVIDCLSALQGGGQTYLINLFTHVPKALSNSLRVIAIIPAGADDLCVNEHIEYVRSPFASAGLLRRLIWSRVRLPGLLRSAKADVFYCPGGSISAFGRWKTAVAFRNMLPFSDESRRLYGLGYLRARLRVLRYVQSRSFRRADLVIFISEFAKSIIDIVVPQRQGVSAVIPHGIADQFLVPPTSASPLSYPYVAYVSILTVYKAQVEVVRAWALLRQAMPGPEKLLLVGPTYHPYAAEVMRTIDECGLQDQVVVLGDVPYAMLPSLYHGAVANIFASSCENCPNILLEALAAGKPVLCSDYQPMPEFARDAALYFDPYDPPSLTRHLMRVLADPELRQRLGQMSRAQAAQFHWEQSAESTWRALAQLAGLSVEATSCVE